MSPHPEPPIREQILVAAGVLLMILPGFSLGISRVEHDAWPPVTDLRFGLILLGLVILLALCLVYWRRARSNGAACPKPDLRIED